VEYKHWLEEERRMCSFCNKGRDDLLHYVEGCEETAKWFRGLGRNKEEIWDKVWSEDLDERKGELLVKIWKEKEKIRRKRESEKVKGKRSIKYKIDSEGIGNQLILGKSNCI